MNLLVVVTGEGSTWRWRIIEGADHILEESRVHFPNLADALEAGRGRLRALEAPPLRRESSSGLRRGPSSESSVA
jgi:hypothetical protein